MSLVQLFVVVVVHVIVTIKFCEVIINPFKSTFTLHESLKICNHFPHLFLLTLVLRYNSFYVLSRQSHPLLVTWLLAILCPLLDLCILEHPVLLSIPLVDDTLAPWRIRRGEKFERTGKFDPKRIHFSFGCGEVSSWERRWRGELLRFYHCKQRTRELNVDGNPIIGSKILELAKLLELCSSSIEGLNPGSD